MRQTSGRHTIFALSSGQLPSGVAIVRVSGPDTGLVLLQLAGQIPVPRRAALRRLTASDGRVLDTAVVLWFPGPASFTGEDCAEFQCHGGQAVVAALLKELAQIEGCRLAEAGEFSLRAFTNGKVDLTQLEALSDLIGAETETQRALAVAQAGGSQRLLYTRWRADLLRARAYIEADLDFSDEDDVPGSVVGAVIPIVTGLAAEVALHLETAAQAEIIRDGFRVVIAGPPNAGKSSLLNTLANRDVAIVTHIAGTTRDVLDVHLDIFGVKIIVSDTAGLRKTSDIIEQIGIERAHLAMARANLVLVLSEDGPMALEISTPFWLVKSKCDGLEVASSGFDFAISSHSGRGIEALMNAIGEMAQSSVGNYSDGLFVSRARHVALLRGAEKALLRFLALSAESVEFGAEELRIASDALGGITGVIGVEDVLGAIFSTFCIGK